jgi:hypothetical protein
MMSARIEQLRQAIETMHECKAVHEGSTPVVEMFGPQTAWEGVVEAFALSGHPKAKRCYAWSYPDAGETQYVTVLELPPVDSPTNAVRVAIAAEARRKD